MDTDNGHLSPYATKPLAHSGGTIMTLIDSHAHLDLSEFNGDRDSVIKRAHEQGIQRIITIGIGVRECKKALQISENNPHVYAALGIHPHNAKTLDLAALDFLEKHGKNQKVVALGEMGLDFFRNLSPRQEQERCFRAQLDLAKSMNLPVIIHDRDAHDETRAIVREEKGGETGGVIHCFSGDVALAFAFIDMGFYIGIPGTVTFKNAPGIQDVATKVPLESLLIETDCPFLAPAPHRGKRNEPCYVRLVAEKIAQLKKTSVEEVARSTTRNAEKLFGL